MAAAPIVQVLLFAIISRSRSESNHQVVSQFGELLKPPPPPPLSKIVPVPFHGGTLRTQRQNELGYGYQPPPPPPPPPLPPNSDFKFPAPFYKQYNFNFVPPPQPFTTTPAPSLFQKVSGWLFPQNNFEAESSITLNSIPPMKKDCNSCNRVPWIPVIRYDLGAKNFKHSLIPTYGPPSPTGYADFQNIPQFRPHTLGTLNEHNQQLSPGLPHAIYRPPSYSNAFESPSSTYGPPSPTHTVPVSSQNSLSSTNSVSSPSYSAPSSTYDVSSSSIGQLSSSYGVPSSSYGLPSTTYRPLSSSYEIPSVSMNTVLTSSTTYAPVTSGYYYGLPQQNEALTAPDTEFQLPKVSEPKGFTNSYGEPIMDSFNALYPVSATAAESSKIKTEVLPNDNAPFIPNVSLALSNPAPFTLNRGRNIHTLQPVALPNLSVSPLPPIFNARPFHPVTKHPLPDNFLQGLNSMQQNSNVNIAQSVALAEFTHSVDYPPSVIQSPVIDVDTSRNNQTKAYRNIPNSYVVDTIRDISSQASEDHVSATRSNNDVSFETTGADYGNNLDDNSMPLDLKFNSKERIPSNHKPFFADLRGIKDEDIDKYRTEGNLQYIDSPLLYLKPSTPHKEYEKFVPTINILENNKDYELYDDIQPTTQASPTSAWDESKIDYSESLSSSPSAQEDSNQPKIVQIIIPYTTGQDDERDTDQRIPGEWSYNADDIHQGRKVPTNTEDNYITHTEDYSSLSSTIPTTEESSQYVTEIVDMNKLSTEDILNDLYDVKEPPFDIIKLQHNIDDWTAQEYSNYYRIPQKERINDKYVKQIPDEYFTTVNPITNYVTNNYVNSYDYYDHVGSSSIRHSVTEARNKTKSPKQYNYIERPKNRHETGKNEEIDTKPHIYTAASSFRSSTTTPAPWEAIQTSISPLTKEKVYVVTSKPWKDNSTKDWIQAAFESKRTNVNNDVSASDNLPLKSPRFPNRSTYGFTSQGQHALENTDTSYSYSKSWHQRINDLDVGAYNRTTSSEGSELKVTTNTDEDTVTTMTAEPRDDTDQ